jgi:hypothetical protein
MCACKESDVRELPNDSTLADGEGQGGHIETCHPQYCESPVSSVIECTIEWKHLWVSIIIKWQFLPPEFFFLWGY